MEVKRCILLRFSLAQVRFVKIGKIFILSVKLKRFAENFPLNATSSIPI
jgi:hypothetical protein